MKHLHVIEKYFKCNVLYIVNPRMDAHGIAYQHPSFVLCIFRHLILMWTNLSIAEIRVMTLDGPSLLSNSKNTLFLQRNLSFCQTS